MWPNVVGVAGHGTIPAGLSDQNERTLKSTMGFSNEDPPTIINTLYSARGEQNGKLTVYFIIDSFLMAEESERESVTCQYLQLNACFFRSGV